MTGAQIVFLICAGLILGSAVMVVTARNLMHAAFWLIAALFGVAVLYALLQAGFMAMIQIVIYIGAIAILFIFADMLTRRDLRDRPGQTRANWWIAALLGALLLAGLAFLVLSLPGTERTPAAMPEGLDTVSALGLALVSPNAYVLPFEVASVLLLAALVGAVYVAGIVKKS